MALINDEIKVLEILSSKKEPLLLRQIKQELNLRISERKLLGVLNDLIKNKRVEKYGTTNHARYAIDNILRYYKKFEFLYVHKAGELAGYLFEMPTSYRFIYDLDFLVNLSSPISTLKLSTGYYDFKELPPVFEQNLPEGINREILQVKTKESVDFKLLDKLEDNIGDLYFSKSPENNKSIKSFSGSYLNVLDEILGTNKKIHILEDFSIDLEDRYIFPQNYDISKQENKQNDGISGFQYKKLCNINFEQKKISFDEGLAKEYIFKPYSKLKADKNSEYYFPHIGINEHLFMSFAKNELGFRVPYSAVLKKAEDEEYHYIVKRFDRYNNHRFSKNTFAAFLGLSSARKYDTSSENMFKRIAKELLSPHERMELLKHYVYSLIIVHEDMHSKNLSLIYDGNKVLFAPLYDVACTGVYQTSRGYESHLSINGKQRHIRVNDLKNLCKILGVDFKGFKKEASSIALAYKTKLPSYLDELDKIGYFPFYKARKKSKAGEIGTWVRKKQSVSFVDILREFHQKRIHELEKYSWL